MQKLTKDIHHSNIYNWNNLNINYTFNSNLAVSTISMKEKQITKQRFTGSPALPRIIQTGLCRKKNYSNIQRKNISYCWGYSKLIKYQIATGHMKPKSNGLLEFWKKSPHIFKNTKNLVKTTVKHNHKLNIQFFKL